MKLGVVALLLSATIVIGIAAFETHALFPAPSNARAEGIVWHGRTFVTRREFARWLRSRGTTYAAWARLHPSLAGIPSGRRGKKSSDWSARNVGGGLVVLAAIGLVAVFVRRRWPDSLESATYAVRLAARRAAPPAKRGARTTLRWTESAALLTASKAESGFRIIRSRGPEFAESLARRVAPVAKRGARLILGLATAVVLLSGSVAMRGARLMLGLAAAAGLLSASAGKRGVRLTSGLPTAVAPLSSGRVASAAEALRRRRGEFVWYLATAILATGIGVLATVWLNRA